METTPFAQWLDTTFAGYDHVILTCMHAAAEMAGFVLTPLFRVISLFADNGVFLVVVAVILLLFGKTRKMGLCMILALALGAIITNLCLKEIIMRPRPFESSMQYFEWWRYAGATIETSRSFPSGHTTAIMAAMMALFLCNDKKKWWPVFIAVVLVGMSRNYLMVHYPSDILGGIIAGAVGAVMAYLIVEALYHRAESHPNGRLAMLLFDLDIRHCRHLSKR